VAAEELSNALEQLHRSGLEGQVGLERPAFPARLA
jgi:hypothetical protein